MGGVRMYQGIGIDALLTIFSHFVFIIIAFRALQALRFDKLLKPNHVRESQVLLVLFAVALGFMTSQFFLSLVTAAKNLAYLFK